LRWGVAAPFVLLLPCSYWTRRDRTAPACRRSIDPAAGEATAGHGKEVPDGLPAVGTENAAGSVARLITGKEHGGSCNVIAAAYAAHGHALAAAFEDLGVSVHGLGAGRADVAGRDGVGADSIGCPLHRLQLGEHDEAGFHDAVGAGPVVGE